MHNKPAKLPPNFFELPEDEQLGIAETLMRKLPAVEVELDIGETAKLSKNLYATRTQNGLELYYAE